MKLTKRFPKIAALRRDAHARLHPLARIRHTPLDIRRHLVLSKMPDLNGIALHLQSYDLLVVVELLVESALRSLETASRTFHALLVEAVVCPE